MEVIRRAVPTAIMFVVLWGSIVFVDRSVIGANYVYTVHDVATGWFGWMLNWLTGEPRLVWYSPAQTSRLINGLVGYFVDVDMTNAPVDKWFQIGTILQGCAVVCCAIWFSWISRILRIDLFDRTFLCVLFFCYPTLLVYIGQWGIYFEYWLLGLPLGLTLYAALNGELRAVRAGGIGCGFLAANIYSSLAVVAAFIFVVVGQRLFHSERQPSGKQNIVTKGSGIYLAAWLGLCTIAWSIGLYFSEIRLIYMEDQRLFVILWSAIIGWLLCSYIVLMLARWEPIMAQFFLWAIPAFVVSSSILLPWYWHGLFLASGKTVGLWQSVSEIWYRIPGNPWYAVVWCFLLFLVGIAVQNIWLTLTKKKSLDHQSIRHILFVAFGTVCVIMVAGATEGPTSGGPERGLFAIAPMFAVGCIAINRSLGKQWRVLFVTPMLILSTYSVLSFYEDYIEAVHQYSRDGGKLDEAITAFLEQEQTGSVVCVGHEFGSKYCTVAYAYNRYRTTASADKLPSWNLYEGRVLSLNVQMPDESGNWDVGPRVVEERLLPIRGPLLIISEGGGFRDSLIELFSTRSINVMPFWRWWAPYRELRGEAVTNLSPGGMFIAGLDTKR